MNRLLAFLVVVPALFMIWLTGFALQTVIAAEATFDASKGLVEARIRINNRVNGRFGIDTGADRLYIDKSYAEENYLAKEGIPDQRKIVGVDGAAGGYFVTLRSFEVGDQRLHNVKATVVDFDKLTGNKNVEHPDGLIGYEILRRMYVTVDYPNQRFDLELTRPRFLSGRQYETVRFKMFNHLILVDVTFSDGKTRPMILDYCATHSTITKQLASELGLSGQTDFSENINMSLAGIINSDGVETIVRDLTDYKKAFSRVKFDGILGRTFLNQHKITINYKKSEIYLHKNIIANN